MMKLATENNSLRQRIGEEEALRLYAKAGFDAIDYSFYGEAAKPDGLLYRPDWKEGAEELRALGKELGLTFHQAHAPFRFDWAAGETHFKEVIFPAIVRSIRMAGILGAEHIVVHPLQHLPYRHHEEELRGINREFYRALLPYAKESGVSIALENMFLKDTVRNCIVPDIFSDPRELRDFYDQLDDPSFSVCVDIGHATIVGEDPAHVLRTLGERVKCVHIHDNNGLRDEHMLPGNGIVRWKEVMAALGEIGYQGALTFEALHYYRSYDDDFLERAAEFMLTMGRYLDAQMTPITKS